MTGTEQRFALSMRQVDDDEPGLIRERDGTVWLVNPDGTRTQLPGASLPTGGATGEVLTKASNADGDADWEAGGGSQPGIPLEAGPAWAPGVAVTEGYQITVSYLGQSRVFDATGAGTTTDDGSVFPDDYSPSLDPLAETNDNDFSWRYLGIVGEISYGKLPAGLVAESGYYSSNQTIVAAGATTFLNWENFDSGDDLLDVSTPNQPVARKGGVFFVSAEVQAVAGPAVGIGLELTFDYTGEAVPIGAGGDGFANISGSYRVPAGGQIRLSARNGDSAEHNIKILNAHVSRVGPG